MPGQIVVLHAYVHEARDEDRLMKLTKAARVPPQKLASVVLKGNFSGSAWIGLHWIVQGGVPAEENQELEWEGPMILRRVPITIDGSDHGEPIRCELHIGTDTGSAGEVAFELTS
jgi:hypothetical protein